MRNKPFISREELQEYLAGDKIQCLECGQWYKQITGRHMAMHGMTHDEYRKKWGMPAQTPLAGKSTRNVRARIMDQNVICGKITQKHLDAAIAAASKAPKPKKSPMDQKAQSELVRDLRPGDWSMLPDGSKRKDGRDAIRRREYQRAYRAAKNGNPEPMREWQEKNQCPKKSAHT